MIVRPGALISLFQKRDGGADVNDRGCRTVHQRCVFCLYSVIESDAEHYSPQPRRPVRLSLLLLCRSFNSHLLRFAAGGIPGWVTTIDGHLRTNDSSYHEAWQQYIREVSQITAANQISEGGPVIAVQVRHHLTFSLSPPPSPRSLGLMMESVAIVGRQRIRHRRTQTLPAR